MLEDDDVVGSGDVTMRVRLSSDGVRARGVLLWLFDASELLLLNLRFFNLLLSDLTNCTGPGYGKNHTLYLTSCTAITITNTYLW